MPQTKELTGHEIAEFEELAAEAKSQWNLLKPKLEVLCAIARRIKDGRLYLARFETYEDFAQATFGRSAKALDSMIWREEKKAEAKAAAKPQKSLETRNTNLEYVGTETESEDKPMPARLDKENEVFHVKPAPLPVPIMAMRCVVPKQIVDLVTEISREANRLQQQGSLAFDSKFCHLVQQIVRLSKLIQPSLPGIDEHFAKAPEKPAASKARCSEEEAIAYCRTLGLPDDDGQWFFAKMEGCGWKNGGKAVVNWQATIKAWKLAGYMGSQKRKSNESRNGSPEPKNHISQEIARDLARVRKGLL